MERLRISTRTKAAISGAARTLFARKGYAETSMREIAAAAGVSKAAIYHYFQDKDRLYHDLLREAVDSLEDAMRRLVEAELPAPAQLAEIVRLHLRFARERPDLTRMLLHEEVRRDGRGRLGTIIRRHREGELGVFTAVIARGTARGEFKAVDPERAGRALAAVVHVLGAEAAVSAGGDGAEAVAENAVDVLLHGLLMSTATPLLEGAVGEQGGGSLGTAPIRSVGQTGSPP